MEKEALTAESVWAMIRETQRQQQETDRKMKETDRKMEESKLENERFLKELSEKLAESTKNMNEALGRWGNNHGAYAEEYFYNTIEKNHTNFFGEKFDDIMKNLKTDGKFNGKIRDEYDIVLVNGKSIGIVEVKFKAHKEQIPKVINKAATFRENFPKYAGHKIYLGLAAMTFDGDVEAKLADEGIAVIKQVGDAMVINDKCLKVF
jgi:hypothetical protein